MLDTTTSEIIRLDMEEKLAWVGIFALAAIFVIKFCQIDVKEKGGIK